MTAETARLRAAFTAAVPGRADTDPLFDLVVEPVEVAGSTVRLARPRDPDALDFDPVGAGPDPGRGDTDEPVEWHPPHWARLWPSAVALAGALPDRDLAGRRVLELGCGLALPSLVAARTGALVTATDLSPAAVALATVNADLAGVRLDAAVVDWAAPEVLLGCAPWDLVLAADVLYGQRAEALLRDLLPRLVDESGTVLLADPGRGPAGRFVSAAGRWSVTSVPVDDGVALHLLRRRDVSRPGRGRRAGSDRTRNHGRGPGDRATQW